MASDALSLKISLGASLDSSVGSAFGQVTREVGELGKRLKELDRAQDDHALADAARAKLPGLKTAKDAAAEAAKVKREELSAAKARADLAERAAQIAERAAGKKKATRDEKAAAVAARAAANAAAKEFESVAVAEQKASAKAKELSSEYARLDKQVQSIGRKRGNLSPASLDAERKRAITEARVSEARGALDKAKDDLGGAWKSVWSWAAIGSGVIAASIFKLGSSVSGVADDLSGLATRLGTTTQAIQRMQYAGLQNNLTVEDTNNLLGNPPPPLARASARLAETSPHTARATEATRNPSMTIAPPASTPTTTGQSPRPSMTRNTGSTTSITALATPMSALAKNTTAGAEARTMSPSSRAASLKKPMLASRTPPSDAARSVSAGIMSEASVFRTPSTRRSCSLMSMLGIGGDAASGVASTASAIGKLPLGTRLWAIAMAGVGRACGFMASLTGGLLTAVQWMMKLRLLLLGGAQSLITFLGTASTYFGGIMSSAWASLTGFASAALPAIGTFITGALSTVGSAIMAVITSVPAMIVAAFAAGFGIGKLLLKLKLVLSFAYAIGDGITWVWDKISDGFDWLWEKAGRLFGFLGKITDKVKGWFGGGKKDKKDAKHEKAADGGPVFHASGPAAGTFVKGKGYSDGYGHYFHDQRGAQISHNAKAQRDPERAERLKKPIQISDEEADGLGLGGVRDGNIRPAPVAPTPTAAEVRASNASSSTTHNNITVNAAPGQSEDAIARKVAERLDERNRRAASGSYR